MEATTTLVVLSYIGPILGITGFIITPGLTVIRPWLIEKLSKDRQKQIETDLNRNYKDMDDIRLIVLRKDFIRRYRWDWRYKIIRKRKELRELVKK